MNARLCCKYHPHGILFEDYTTGDLVCTYCGLVVGDRMLDPGSEWRSFANDEGPDRCRVGEAESSLKGSDFTSISIQKSYDPRHLNENGTNKFQLFSKVSSHDKSINNCKSELKSVCEKLKVDKSTAELTLSIFNKLLNSEKCPRRKNKSLISACLYLACRDNELSRTIGEICDASGCKPKEISKSLKVLIVALDKNIAFTDPEQFVPRFLYKLDMKDMKVEKRVRLMVRQIEKKKLLVNKSPTAIVAGCIFYVAQSLNMNVTLPMVAQITNTSISHIRALYKLLKLKSNEFTPEINT